MDNYVITIARGFGSGGKEIGEKLSKKLGIPCYDKQIIKMASDKSGLNESLFADVDEKLRGSYLSNLLKRVPFTRVVSPEDKDFTSDMNLFNIQSEIIKQLARTESCIIIGKCANMLLCDYSNVASFYIEAPRQDCVRSIMDKMYVTEQVANELIQKTDKYRSDYYKYYTGGGDWTNPVSYDMTLNSARVGREQCAETIIHYITNKFGENIVKRAE